MFSIRTAVQSRAHSFQVLEASTSSLYLGRVPLTTINHMQVIKILPKKIRVIYRTSCTTVPINRAVKTNDSIRTKAIIAFANRVSFSRGLRDRASRKHPKTTPVARAAMLTGNIMKAKTVILEALTRNILLLLKRGALSLSAFAPQKPNIAIALCLVNVSKKLL